MSIVTGHQGTPREPSLSWRGGVDVVFSLKPLIANDFEWDLFK